MPTTDDLITLFVEEIDELLAACESAPQALASDPTDADAAGAVHRLAHTVKTSAGLLGLESTRRFARALEACLAPARRGAAPLDDAVVHAVPGALDTVRALRDELERSGQEPRERLEPAAETLEALRPKN